MSIVASSPEASPPLAEKAHVLPLDDPGIGFIFKNLI
jgi:hypothetical protein